MDHLFYWFLPLGLLAAFLGSVAIWSRRRLRIKLLALGAVLLFIPAAYAGLADLLSKPKPIALEWAEDGTEEALVLGAALREEKEIYLWLQLPGVAEPRAYVLPWDLELALELQEAMRRAEENDTGIIMRLPFEPSGGRDDPTFYPLPQPALPPKYINPDDAAPLQYIHPELQI